MAGNSKITGDPVPLKEFFLIPEKLNRQFRSSGKKTIMASTANPACHLSGCSNGQGQTDSRKAG